MFQLKPSTYTIRLRTYMYVLVYSFAAHTLPYNHLGGQQNDWIV